MGIVLSVAPSPMKFVGDIEGVRDDLDVPQDGKTMRRSTAAGPALPAGGLGLPEDGSGALLCISKGGARQVPLETCREGLRNEQARQRASTLQRGCLD